MSGHLNHNKVNRQRAARGGFGRAIPVHSPEALRRQLRELARDTETDIGSVWDYSDEEKLELIGYLMDVKKGVR